MYLILGGAGAQVASFVSLVLLARVLPVADNGSYRQLLLIAGIVVPVLSGGIGAAAVFLLRSGGHASPRRSAAAVLTVATAVAIALMGGLGLFRGSIAVAVGNAGLAGVLPAFLPYIGASVIVGVLPSILVAVGRARLSGVMSFLNAAVVLAALTLLMGISPSLRAAVYALSGATTLAAVLAYVVVWRVIPSGEVPASPSFDDCRDVAVFALPICGASLLYLAGLRANQFLVAHFTTTEEFAVYAVTAMEVPIIGLVQSSIQAVLLPELVAHAAAGDRSGLAAIWREAASRSSAILLPTFFCLLWLSRPLIEGMFGAEYGAGVWVFRIFLCLIPLRMMTFSAILKAYNRPVVEVQGSALFLVATSLLGVAAWHVGGIVGIAASVVVSLMLLSAFYVWRSSKVSGLGLADLLPRVLWTNTARAGVPFAALLALSRGARHMRLPDLVGVIAGVAFLLVTYALLFGRHLRQPMLSQRRQ